MVEEDREGTKPINRHKTWQIAERRKDKRKKKHPWSTKGGYIAPIFVPSTPNSELFNILKEIADKEAEPGLKFKILEKGGRTVKKSIQSPKPTATGGCGSQDCVACRGGTQNSLCRKSNMQYKYRNLYSRGKEHENNYRKDSPQSFMIKHQTEKHYGEAANFTAKVTVCFKDSFSRQISEGVYIRRSNCEVLNSKAEWHQPALWRVRNELTTD
jgi:hypothetical protein